MSKEAEAPNPLEFKINEAVEENGYLVADITYPNCSNFEGRKIILFDNVSKEWLYSLSELDPHFEENGYIVARFEPTKRGIQLAIKAALCPRN